VESRAGVLGVVSDQRRIRRHSFLRIDEPLESGYHPVQDRSPGDLCVILEAIDRIFSHRGDFAKMARKPVIDTVQSQEREEHHQHDHFRHAIPLSLFEAGLLDHGWQFKGLCRIYIPGIKDLILVPTRFECLGLLRQGARFNSLVPNI